MNTFQYTDYQRHRAVALMKTLPKVAVNTFPIHRLEITFSIAGMHRHEKRPDEGMLALAYVSPTLAYGLSGQILT